MPVQAAWLCLALALGVALADRCQVSTVVVHCDARCDGVNATIFSSVGATENLVPTADAVEALAELERDSVNTRRKSGGQPLMFLQLQESATLPAWFWEKGQRTTDTPVYAAVHEMLSPDQLVEMVGPLDKLEWQGIKSSHLGCVDGRHASGGMYAYGGDFGEFLLALTVYEHMVQRKLSQGETTSLFIEWLRRLDLEEGGFAFCTSETTVSLLASAVGASSLDLTMPPEDVRPSLMLRLVAPEFTGSEHVKWMLQNPDSYAVRRELVEQLLRSFFGVLWNEFHPQRRRLRLDVFSGGRSERAMVQLHTSRWCYAEQGLGVAMPTRSPLGSIFVHTPDAVAERRSALVTFFTSRASPPVEAFEMRSRVSVLGEGQADLTKKAMTGMLRSYSVLVK